MHPRAHPKNCQRSLPKSRSPSISALRFAVLIGMSRLESFQIPSVSVAACAGGNRHSRNLSNDESKLPNGVNRLIGGVPFGCLCAYYISDPAAH